MKLYKYQGAGNDFLIADNRDGNISLTVDRITQLCDRRYGIGADGLMLLENGREDYDFKMVYYNSDGSGGMMCGNGGRCIVAFAHRLLGKRQYLFMAADGPHHAEILADEGDTLTVKLGMKDVDEMQVIDRADLNATFMDTGTRHLVVPVTGVADYDVFGEGRRLRYLPEFGPIGVNVNFIEYIDGKLHVRTYEKGVEDETYACGTGITASAIAATYYGMIRGGVPAVGEHVTVPVQALRDSLAVEFSASDSGATSVSLIGPATYVAEILVDK